MPVERRDRVLLGMRLDLVTDYACASDLTGAIWFLGWRFLGLCADRVAAARRAVSNIQTWEVGYRPVPEIFTVWVRELLVALAPESQAVMEEALAAGPFPFESLLRDALRDIDAARPG